MDALCIMQDDDNWKYTLANSYLTIIAADGADADYILRSLRGMSKPRMLDQKVHRLNYITIAGGQRAAAGWMAKKEPLEYKGVKLTSKLGSMPVLY